MMTADQPPPTDRPFFCAPTKTASGCSQMMPAPWRRQPWTGLAQPGPLSQSTCQTSALHSLIASSCSLNVTQNGDVSLMAGLNRVRICHITYRSYRWSWL